VWLASDLIVTQKPVTLELPKHVGEWRWKTDNKHMQGLHSGLRS
jgi:hypothetical protein